MKNVYEYLKQSLSKHGRYDFFQRLVPLSKTHAALGKQALINKK